ncbi:CidA/LrgA family protein [Marininema halotolerans]|uniref:Holin-like protein n=1 Tax=Marininema halotolerans TaxID=1155944 RepID=A0A1I6TJ48_9BACL|nr:CidA/LrgA family protein [Marininema halotolerans]SFS89239.1 holin-like protein [Marininema halotolerans]
MRTWLIPVQVTGLWGIYKSGCWIKDLLQIPIPGSLIGMILLLCLLLTGIIPERWFAIGSEWLLRWLPLFFLPSIAGVLGVLPFLKEQGWTLAGVVLVNTLFVMMISSLMSQRLLRRRYSQEGEMD